MKFILHDWSDEKCIQILKNVARAMRKGYSTLIIEDFILPEMGCHALPAVWDLVMMGFLASMERTRTQWLQVLEPAGFKVEGFYPPPGDGTGIIVTHLKA